MQEFTGKEYLKIDIANHYGLDKKNWNQRLEWFDEHEDVLESLVKEADEPAEYYAAVLAYREMQKGNPIGYLISLDSTSSGIQLLSIMLADIKAAAKCNVINTGNREDIYTILYKKMCDKVQDKEKIKREDVKKSIMTACYGSQATPKRIFGDGSALYASFLAVMNEELPYIWKFMECCLDLWNPTATEYGWVMPDNFHVHTKIKGLRTETVNFLNTPIEVTTKVCMPQEKGRSYSANITHSVDSLIVREMSRRCMYNKNKIERVKDILAHASIFKMEYNEKNEMLETLWKHYKESGFLSLRIIDYINPDTVSYIDDPDAVLNLINTLPEKPFNIITIHDAFKCHPNYGNDVRRQYKNLLKELAKSNILNNILRQLTGREEINIPKPFDFYDAIEDAEYALS